MVVAKRRIKAFFLTETNGSYCVISSLIFLSSSFLLFQMSLAWKLIHKTKTINCKEHQMLEVMSLLFEYKTN